MVNDKIDEIKEKVAELTAVPKPPPLSVKETLDAEEAVASSLNPTIIVKFAKKMGYVKKEIDEPEHVKQFKIAMLTFIVLVCGDLIIFFSNAIVDGTWSFTPVIWQILIMSVIKDMGVGLIGKILKFYNRHEKPINLA